MNKADLVSTIANDCQISRADASTALNCLLKEVTKALTRGEDVYVAGFGTLAIRRRRACGGRNPQTGASLIIPASNIRVRIVREIESGQSCRAAARRFGVIAATAVRLAQRKAPTGSITPSRQGRPPGRGPLSAHADVLEPTAFCWNFPTLLALIFAVPALVMAILGFGGLAGAFIDITQILFWLPVIIAVLLFVLGFTV